MGKGSNNLGLRDTARQGKDLRRVGVCIMFLYLLLKSFFQEVPRVNRKVVCNSYLPGREFPKIAKLY